MIDIDSCWCGSREFETFSDQYLKCRSCKTLVRRQRMEESFYESGSDKFYGREYWTKHIKQEYGYEDIFLLTRRYLSDRCIYWLKEVLKYKSPPARALELGCGHGAFVYLMRLAGFDAVGTEMSQWLCDFAKDAFAVPVFCGRIEDLDSSPDQYDMVVLMDVLEHMTAPLKSLRRIGNVLKNDGIAVIQTPCFKEVEMTREDLERTNSIFLPQLKEKEHLYLFNEKSITGILKEAGLHHVAFEPAIFPYDMFVFASKSEMVKKESAPVDELNKTPQGRMALALIDVYGRNEGLREELSVCEKDRKARLKIIETQGLEFGKKIGEIEADREARLKVIHKQASEFGVKIRELEADRAARLNVIHKQAREFAKEVNRLKSECEDMRKQIDQLQKQQD